MGTSTKIDSDLEVFAKSEEQLQEETINYFNDNNISTHKGSIAMLFANIINKGISTCYEAISKLYRNCFVSSAKGEYLDDIASTVSIVRGTDESDDSVRYRISIHNLYNSMCNYTGIRQRILDKYEAVEDVKIQEYNKGSGSCKFIIFANNLKDTDYIEIKKHILMYSPPGVNVTITTPELLPYKINAIVELKTELTDSEKIDVRNLIRENLYELIVESNNRVVTQYEVINSISKSSDYISGCKLTGTIVNGVTLPVTTISPDINYRNILANDNEIIFV